MTWLELEALNDYQLRQVADGVFVGVAKRDRRRALALLVRRHSGCTPWHSHALCWAFRIAAVIPFLHLLLHVIGFPHPEVLTFIP